MATLLTTGQRTGVPNMIWMKVVCCIIQKMEMVPAVARVMVAVALDVVALIVADTVPEGTMMVALLLPVLPTQCKDELIHRPRAIPMMMLSFCRIT